MTLTVRSCDGWQQLPENWPAALKKALAARGITAETDLFYELKSLPKPQQLLGLSAAVSLLSQAIKHHWHIAIVADFDADGATSCALAIRGLQAMGAKKVSYIVPNRFEHGYGLTEALLATVPVDAQPDLLMTVDNGIASIDGVNYAKQRGMKVIVTDHHLPGETLPDADAIVNPNQVGDTFPSKNMAGVGVCFYVLLGLRQALRQQQWFEQQQIDEPNLMQFTDLLALGTVADVVPLDKINRTWVNLGLARIRSGKACAGIQALFQAAGKSAEQCGSTDLGFYIGPRLNAAGRLDDMGLGIEALLTDDVDEALHYAHILHEMNGQRREVEQTMQEDALAMLPQLSKQSTQPVAYCLYDSAWHQGVVGLLASRIKEKHHRPVIVFAPADNDMVKGSARSITGIHIRDVLARVATQVPNILSHFGGHAMAAGLTIKRDNLIEFERQLLMAITEMYSNEVFDKTYQSDGQLSGEEINLSLAAFLPKAMPWGQGFPMPVFHGDFVIQQVRTVGQQHQHLRLTLVLPDQRLITAMAFGQAQPNWLKEGLVARLYYRLDINEYRDQKTVQLLVDEIMPAESQARH